MFAIMLFGSFSIKLFKVMLPKKIPTSFSESNYRLHTRREEEVKNLVPLSNVVKGVLLQQLVQAAVALFLVSHPTKTCSNF